MYTTILFEILRYATMAWNTCVSLGNWVWWGSVDTEKNVPTRRYFLSDEYEFDESYTRVPEDAVYIEEWTSQSGIKKCRVLYEGDEIPYTWSTNPHTLTAKCPWVWVGEKNTEIDLTRTFNKFLVPGNWIRLDLVEKLIQIVDNTELIYIATETFESVKFPGTGILIEEDAE